MPLQRDAPLSDSNGPSKPVLMQGRNILGTTTNGGAECSSASSHPHRISQQLSISTPHIEQAISNETADLILQWADFPIVLRPTAKAEQRFGDDAVAGASQFRVECAQDQDVPVARLLRKVMPPVARWASGQRQPEPQRRFGAQLEQRVERQDDDEGRWSRRWRLSEPEAMLPARCVPETVPGSADGRLYRETGKPRQHDGHREVTGRIARWAEFDSVRLKCWRPEERCAIGGLVRVRREIATPSGL